MKKSTYAMIPSFEEVSVVLQVVEGEPGTRRDCCGTHSSAQFDEGSAIFSGLVLGALLLAEASGLT
jgi:hypothetical protein